MSAVSAVATAALLAGCGSTVPLAEQRTLAAGQGASSGADGSSTATASGISASAASTPGGSSISTGPAAQGGAAAVAGSSGPDGSAQALSPGSTANGPTAGAGTATVGAVTGAGWNAKDVYIGFPTENDISTAAGALGVSLNPGSEDNDVNAVVNWFNARGGVLGRRIVPVFHDNSTADIESNPNAVSQANCTYFTQDQPVTEVVNFVASIFLAGCLQQHRVPDIEGSTNVFDTQAYTQYGPFLYTSLFPNVDVVAPSLVDQLQAEHYFTGWNTALGEAGTARVKVGILEPDTAVGKDIAAKLSGRLQALHEDVASTFLYDDSAQSYGSEMDSAVLQFGAAGVTHVINIPPINAALLFFSEAAESQHYRPRYAMTSYSWPNQAQGDMPAAQVNGAMGIGWFPGVDVGNAQAPAPGAAEQACDSDFKQANVNNTNPLAIGYALALCDDITLFVQAADASGGFSPVALAAGIAQVGPHFSPAATFESVLSSSNHFLPGAVRDLAYFVSCKCFEYTGPPMPMASS